MAHLAFTRYFDDPVIQDRVIGTLFHLQPLINHPNPTMPASISMYPTRKIKEPDNFYDDLLKMVSCQEVTVNDRPYRWYVLGGPEQTNHVLVIGGRNAPDPVGEVPPQNYLVPKNNIGGLGWGLTEEDLFEINERGSPFARPWFWELVASHYSHDGKPMPFLEHTGEAANLFLPKLVFRNRDKGFYPPLDHISQVHEVCTSMISTAGSVSLNAPSSAWDERSFSWGTRLLSEASVQEQMARAMEDPSFVRTGELADDMSSIVRSALNVLSESSEQSFASVNPRSRL